MALEQSATYLDSLVQTNPDGSTDLLSTVDNHLRLTKGAIKRTFPNLAAPVTATQGELNSLVGQSWNELVVALPNRWITIPDGSILNPITLPYKTPEGGIVDISDLSLSITGFYVIDMQCFVSASASAVVKSKIWVSKYDDANQYGYSLIDASLSADPPTPHIEKNFANPVVQFPNYHPDSRTALRVNGTINYTKIGDDSPVIWQLYAEGSIELLWGVANVQRLGDAD